MADNRVPELVTDMEDQMSAALRREARLDSKKARSIAQHVTRHITDNWGGQLIYIPKNHGGKLSERDLKIWSEFNGMNHVELAKKYNLTMQQIYKIVKQVRAQEAAKNQPDLFV